MAEEFDPNDNPFIPPDKYGPGSATWISLVDAYLNGGPAPPGMTLAQIKALNAAVRKEIREPKQLCNAAGGLVTQTGNVCLFGDAATTKANEILNNPDAPQGIKDKAQRWLDANPTDTETTDTETTEDEIVDGVNVTVLEKKYGKEIVDAIFDTAGEAIDIIKQTAEDPQAAIDNFIDTYGTKTKTGSWKDWTEVGVFGGIAGIPLPPGFIGGTVRELEDKLKEIGVTISDIFTSEDPLGKISEEIEGVVDGVLGGTEDSPWGVDNTLETIGGWIVDILGPTLGSTILSTTSSAIETSIQDAISIGGAVDTDDEEEEDSTDRFSQLLGTVQDTLETDDVVDIGADSTLDDDTTTTVGGDPNSTDVFSSLLGTVTSNLKVDDTKKSDDTVLVGGDLNDPDPDYPARGTYASAYCETRGDTGGTLVTSYHDGAGGTYSESSFSSSCKTTIPGGGATVDDTDTTKVIVGSVIDDSLNYDDDPVIEIGGTEEPEAATGGGGSVGGGQASATPFMKLVPYTRTVPLALQPSMPTNYASGLMAAPAITQASGLMRPTNSMDVLGQIIARNMKA